MSAMMEEMGQRALKLGIPLSVQLDLTYRCNERCVHCYLDHEDHGEMNTPEIITCWTTWLRPAFSSSPSAAAKF